MLLKGVSFDVQCGEIFGIAGVAGNGQSELVEVITGIRKCYSGKIIFDGENIENLTPREIIDKKYLVYQKIDIKPVLYYNILCMKILFWDAK